MSHFFCVFLWIDEFNMPSFQIGKKSSIPTFYGFLNCRSIHNIVFFYRCRIAFHRYLMQLCKMQDSSSLTKIRPYKTPPMQKTIFASFTQARRKFMFVGEKRKQILVFTLHFIFVYLSFSSVFMFSVYFHLHLNVGFSCRCIWCFRFAIFIQIFVRYCLIWISFLSHTEKRSGKLGMVNSLKLPWNENKFTLLSYSTYCSVEKLPKFGQQFSNLSSIYLASIICTRQLEHWSPSLGNFSAK